MNLARCSEVFTTGSVMTTSQLYKTDAINLKSYPLKEADKIMVMYSRDCGLIKAVAKGTKKVKSSLGARMESFVANSVMLSKGRNMDVVAQAETINSFSGTRKDLDKIFYSMYATEVINNFGTESDSASREVYDVLYRTLNSISNAYEKKEILLASMKFQLKIMKISGFLPEFNRCLKCGREIEDDGYYSPEHFGVLCPECAGECRGKIILHKKIREFLNYLTNSDFDIITDYEIKATEKVCQTCFDFLKDCLSKNSLKQIKTEKALSFI